MDSREAPLFVAASGVAYGIYIIAPLNEGVGIAPTLTVSMRLVYCSTRGMPRIAENEPIESCTASDAMA